MIKASDVLNQLDECAEEGDFPLFSGEEATLLVTRMSIFFDEQYWAIAMEWLIHDWGFLDWEQLVSEVQFFGNNLTVHPGTLKTFARFRPGERNLFRYPMNEDPMTEVELDPEGDHYWVRDREYTLSSTWMQRIPNLDQVADNKEGNDELAEELLREIGKQHANETWLTQDEFFGYFQSPLKLNSTLSDWLHPDITAEEMPSGNPFFCSLALHIEEGRKEPFRYSGPTNTNDEFWSERRL